MYPFTNLLNNDVGSVPEVFTQKYFKENVITPSGISVLIKEYIKIGKINIQCKSCMNHEILKNEFRKIISDPNDTKNGFIVKSKDPYQHLATLFVSKKNGIFRILILDTQGGRSNYDPSTLYDLKELNIPKMKIFNLYEKREFESSVEGAFAFHDLLSICKDTDIIDKLEIKTEKRNSINLTYLPEIKFIPIYLKDLETTYIKLVNDLDIINSFEIKIKIKHIKNKINILSHHHFKKYLNILKNRMKLEYHVRTTYDGDILTPEGLNIILEIQKENGELKVECIALKTYTDLYLKISQFIDSDFIGVQSYLVKSKDPHDHISPIFIKKEYDVDNTPILTVILTDTGGGQTYYDPSALWTLESLKLKNILIYNLYERRQWDNNTCPIFSNNDIIHLSQMTDPFLYFQNIVKDREQITLIHPTHKVPKIKFYPIYLKDLPEDFVIFTTRYATLLNYADSLSNQRKEEFLKDVNEHVIDVRYDNRIVKSNIWAQEINDEYAEVIRKLIV